jgi:hypothetical protein
VVCGQVIEEFIALDVAALRMLILCKVIISTNQAVALSWLG